ncbi:MAG: hypothetical protein ACFB0A_12835 [Croceivirga sp.]
MRLLLTLCTLLCMSVFVSAQASPLHADTFLVRQTEIFTAEQIIVEKQLPQPKARSIARLYLFKNSRIKKALAFRTKANKAKLA